jgi:hypothetical protein
MTDWNAIVAARKLEIPPDDVAKFVPVLDALEEAFCPLLTELSYTGSE